MKRIFTFVLALAACGGGSAGTPVQNGPGPTTLPKGVKAGAGTHKTAGTGATAATPPDLGCPTTSCTFHPGASAYFTCLSGGAGACFHFGGPCAPADGCMYDPGARVYKQCAHPVEGTCPAFGGACTPHSACMFDPADGLHHHCDEPDAGAGTCRRYGALCAP